MSFSVIKCKCWFKTKLWFISSLSTSFMYLSCKHELQNKLLNLFVGYYKILYDEYTARLYQFTSSERKCYLLLPELNVNFLFTRMKFNISVLWIVFMMTKKISSLFWSKGLSDVESLFTCIVLNMHNSIMYRSTN